MTEALFAVAQAAQAQIQILGLLQEFLSQIAVGEVPEVLLVDEGVGDGQELGLVAAVAGQRESGDTGDVNGAALGQDTIQNGCFVAQNAVGLNVDANRTIGQGLNLLLEIGSDHADDGALNGVYLSVGQSNSGAFSADGDCQAQNHNQSQSNADKLFHFVSSYVLLFE